MRTSYSRYMHLCHYTVIVERPLVCGDRPAPPIVANTTMYSRVWCILIYYKLIILLLFLLSWVLRATRASYLS